MRIPLGLRSQILLLTMQNSELTVTPGEYHTASARSGR